MSPHSPVSNDPPRITIGIPFFRAAYFDRALKSVIAQEHQNWQVIVSDNCSGPEDRDEVQAVLAAHPDPRITYVRSDVNLGAEGNWNRVLDLADTELCTLLHSDDELLPNYCNEMLQLAAKHPEATAFFCQPRIIDERSVETFSFPDWYKRLLMDHSDEEMMLHSRAGVRSLLPGNYIFCPTLCFRMPKLGTLRFGQASMCSDMELILNILIEGGAIVGTHRQAFSYRRHSLSTTSVVTENLIRFRSEAAFYDQIAERCAALGWDECARLASGKQVIKLNLAYCSVLDLLQWRWNASVAKLELLVRLLTGQNLTA